MAVIVASALCIGVLGLLFGLVLAFASRKFAVKVDPRVEQLMEVLPCANCGGCGFPGCAAFAEALVEGDAKITQCAPGGPETAEQAARILGVEVDQSEPVIAFVHCGGGCDIVADRYQYIGLEDCATANLLQGGPKACLYGCLGYGTCAEVCPFDAITMSEQRLPVIDPKRCTACGKCVTACPKNLITLVSRKQMVLVRCSSQDKGAVVRKVCEVGCIGCMKCTKVCPVGQDASEKAILVTNYLARINYEICINCGLCASECPTGCIVDYVAPRGKAWIDPDKCIGCRLCAKNCPVDAISGEPKQVHQVDPDKCIGCGICVAKCPPKVQAITMQPPGSK